MTKRKKYNLTQDMIARFLKYSTPQSFNSSSAKDRILEGIEKIIEHIEKEMIQRMIK